MKFPANREIYREFHKIRGSTSRFGLQLPSASKQLQANSLRTETGNFSGRNRECNSAKREMKQFEQRTGPEGLRVISPCKMQGESTKMQGSPNPAPDENLRFSVVYDVPSLLQ